MSAPGWPPSGWDTGFEWGCMASLKGLSNRAQGRPSLTRPTLGHVAEQEAQNGLAVEAQEVPAALDRRCWETQRVVSVIGLRLIVAVHTLGIASSSLIPGLCCTSLSGLPHGQIKRWNHARQQATCFLPPEAWLTKGNRPQIRSRTARGTRGILSAGLSDPHTGGSLHACGVPVTHRLSSIEPPASDQQSMKAVQVIGKICRTSPRRTAYCLSL